MATNGTLLGTRGVVGVWNNTDCSLFRNDTVKSYFIVWPEGLYGIVKYCCQDGFSPFSLVNFTYGIHEGLLDPRPYFDLGIVAAFEPYWKFWTFWRVPTTNIATDLHCDYKDLHNLYFWRFWKYSISHGAETGLVLWVILQVAVWVFLFCLWAVLSLLKDRFPSLKVAIKQMPKKIKMTLTAEFWEKIWDIVKRLFGKLKWPAGENIWHIVKNLFGKLKWPQGEICTMEKLKEWIKTPGWPDFIADLAHLLLLAVSGSCMMEAVGHSNLHMWRASVMYNAGVVYNYLILFAIVSSIFRQHAMWWFSLSELRILNDKKSSHADSATGNNSTTGWETLCKAWRSLNELNDDLGDAWKAFRKVTDFWRWQRVFGHIAVLVLMGTYLQLVDDDNGTAMNTVAGLVLAAVVAACIWSVGSIILVACRAGWFMWSTKA